LSPSSQAHANPRQTNKVSQQDHRRPAAAGPQDPAPADSSAPLSRREREIMDIVYRAGSASASEIHSQLANPPVQAAVRTLLRILEEKNQLRHEKKGARHIYFPITPRSVARRSAVRHLIGTFFGGSSAEAVAALLDESDPPLTGTERAQLRSIIRRLRAEGK
jgi:predicted transcriptional regulator